VTCRAAVTVPQNCSETAKRPQSAELAVALASLIATFPLRSSRFHMQQKEPGS